MMRVKEVVYIEDYKLKLTFSDKSVKVVDLENMVKKSHGIFSPLKNIDYFRQVEIDDAQISICWPNGADMCPDVLYAMGKDLKIKTRSQTKPTSIQSKKHWP